MPEITVEQRLAFIQKYQGVFDDEVLLDQGLFKGLTVKDADHVLVENLGGQSYLLWLINTVLRNFHDPKHYDHYYNDKRLTFYAIRHYFCCEGTQMVEKLSKVKLEDPPTWRLWQDYSRSSQCPVN